MVGAKISLLIFLSAPDVISSEKKGSSVTHRPMSGSKLASFLLDVNGKGTGRIGAPAKKATPVTRAWALHGSNFYRISA